MERPQIFLFCYHKVGTQLFSKIARKICLELDWTFTGIAGRVPSLETSSRIVLFQHSSIGFDLSRIPHRGIRLIRDPRDVWLSGYLYHRHCSEKWCLNEDLDPTGPINFPRVPWSQQHRSKKWKKVYLEGLGGKSYQQNLLELNEHDGLRFEGDRYANWTVTEMGRWKPDPDTLDIRIEEIAENFDGTFHRIFRHLGLSEADIPRAMGIAQTQDVGRMSDAEIDGNPHIHTRQISKWKNTLPGDLVQAFEARHASVISQLGYPLETRDGSP